MTKPRVKETDHGIQGDGRIIAAYDEMQRNMRDRGWNKAGALVKQGLTCGHALEIGPGPGYLGLEWLKSTQGTQLTGLDISPDMIALASQNAQQYGLLDRVEYRLGNGDALPFADQQFDLVFSNGSLHEWQHPDQTFTEIVRVLKPGGKWMVTDLRRDLSLPVKWFLWWGTRPAFIRPWLNSSIDAAYTPAELEQMLHAAGVHGCQVGADPFGVTVTGDKP